MSQETENTQVVQAAYAAFGRGDIPALLGSLADDIRWEPVLGLAAHLPFAGVRMSKSGVADFFRQIAETTDFEQFEARKFVAQGDTVVALGHYRGVTKATHKVFDADFVMVFTLRGGKIATFQEFGDSAGINAAFV